MTSNFNSRRIQQEFSTEEIKLISEFSFRFSLDQLYETEDGQPLDMVNAIRHYRQYVSTVQPFTEIVTYLKKKVGPKMKIELPLEETDIPVTQFVYGTCNARCFLCERYKVCLTRRRAFSSRAILSRPRVLQQWARYHAHCIKWTHEISLKTICHVANLDTDEDEEDEPAEEEEDEDEEESEQPAAPVPEDAPTEDDSTPLDPLPFVNPIEAGPDYNPVSPGHAPEDEGLDSGESTPDYHVVPRTNPLTEAALKIALQLVVVDYKPDYEPEDPTLQRVKIGRKRNHTEQ